tara:strand:- start:2469 stop:2666 length:198 start_codon:yes stop_codon:yes gene_type:complete
VRCPAYEIPSSIFGAFRATKLLENGTINLDQIDLWTYEMTELIQAEKTREQRDKLREQRQKTHGR